jgi:hypothetical protein
MRRPWSDLRPCDARRLLAVAKLFERRDPFTAAMPRNLDGRIQPQDVVGKGTLLGSAAATKLRHWADAGSRWSDWSSMTASSVSDDSMSHASFSGTVTPGRLTPSSLPRLPALPEHPAAVTPSSEHTALCLSPLVSAPPSPAVADITAAQAAAVDNAYHFRTLAPAPKVGA